jgi:uncharacterized membrane protein
MPATPRYDAIDALRGVALLWMTAFHLGFDLNHFGYWQQDYYRDPFWTMQRTCILSLFLFCAGLGQAVALHQGQTWARFWRRWAQIAACALLVTAGSAWMYPRSFIFFGVLHGMAVMLVLVRLTAHWGPWLWPAGLVAIGLAHAAPMLLAGSGWASGFNGPWLSWLGLVTVKPVTEDYVPVLPWLGVMWWGMAAGQWVLRAPPAWLGRRWTGAAGLGLASWGRWSLSWYMLHQPVMIGALMLLGWLRR